MKFAKELERECVPEWRIKYLNYKAGKKYVKAVSTSINRVHTSTPATAKKGDVLPHLPPPFLSSPITSRSRQRDADGGFHGPGDTNTLQTSPEPIRAGQHQHPSKPQGTPKHNQTPHLNQAENSSLTKSPGNGGNYGSINPAPGSPSKAPSTAGSRNPFQLPAPAMRVPSNASEHPSSYSHGSPRPLGKAALRRSASIPPGASGGLNDRVAESPSAPSPQSHQQSPGRLRRLFTTGPTPARTFNSRYSINMQAMDTVRLREKEFFDFLDSELDKVESFYQQKEEQAGARLIALRQQLHEMKNRRTDELARAKRQKEQDGGSANGSTSRKASGNEHPQNVLTPIKARFFKPGPNSKALSVMPLTPVLGSLGYDPRRDHTRKPQSDDVPYRVAKRKLKLALEEFYRGLELLKAYTLLNRTAFRKLNKKYDKAVNARPQYRYMNEKVNKAWFVNSDIVENYIRDVEDLYARYFEGNNHKVAAGKLRRLIRRPVDESATTFQSGLYLGIGVVFLVQGVIYGTNFLSDSDPVVREQTGYLLQLYGGYFLILLLFALFCLDCSVWTANKINYQFIFEFDPRHQLDWRQLAVFPCFFLMIFGVVVWLNFTQYTSSEMYLYYPVVLIVLSLVIILFPAPVLWHKSRRWFAYSHYRLLLAGLYPVEFRDFFLGDMYCSLTYATCNIELFFCLYAHDWEDPDQCNSNNSRLLGFFAALPPIWRALQCIRRYYDTRDVFPHLVNCGKYCMTIMAAVTLSLYRIDGSNANLGTFITFSIINSIYCSIWDLLMDFSLLQPDARRKFLRDLLGLKRRWPYYGIMVVDPILRFAWIFYAIFTHDTQHSTTVSFLLGFAEVIRRGMWALFRVENEHCFNVAAYKASRDLPLPYTLGQESITDRVSSEEPKRKTAEDHRIASAIDPSAAGSSARTREEAISSVGATQPTPGLEAGASGLRRRRSEAPGSRSIRGIMAEAHRQDFEKKRRLPESTGDDDEHEIQASDEEDDEDDTASVLDERMEARRAESLVGGDWNHEA